MSMPEHILDLIQASTDQQRLVETATRLIQVPSPTLSAGVALDTLAEILTEAQFESKPPRGRLACRPRRSSVAAVRSARPHSAVRLPSGHSAPAILPTQS